MGREKNKHNAERCLESGIRFDSKMEALYYSEVVKPLMDSGEIVSCELQKPYVLQEGFERNGKQVRPITYKADFCLEYKDGRIVVIDSKCACSGEGLLAYYALKRRREGATLDENADFVHELRDHIGHAFTVKDLKHLYRGGRLSRGAFVVGQAIKLNPILMVNERGALVHVGNVTGRKIAIRALLAKMEKESAGYKNDVIIVAHGDCIEDAELLAAKVREDYPESRVIITDVGPIIGSHCGKGMLALLYLAASKCDGRV